MAMALAVSSIHPTLWVRVRVTVFLINPAAMTAYRYEVLQQMHVKYYSVNKGFLFFFQEGLF